MSNQRIGVIQGGPFPGREQSLLSGERVAEALRQRGHEVVQIEAGASPELVSELLAHPIDVAFVTLPHGAAREGVLGVLELLGVAYTGSTPLANALCRDRLKSKELFRLHNLPTAPHYLASCGGSAALKDVHGSFGYPVRVSPRELCADLPTQWVGQFSELCTAVDDALNHSEQAIVERAVEGVVVSVALLEGRLLGAVQLRAGQWQTPELDPTRVLGILNLAERAARVLECRGAVSVSTLVTQGGNEYILEVDAAPSLGADSVLTELAGRAGWNFGELCEALLEVAQGRQRRASARPTVRAARKVEVAPALEPNGPRAAESAAEPLRVAV